MARVLVATADGVHEVGVEARPALPGRDVNALAAAPDGVWALAEGRHVLRAGADGEWREVARSPALDITCLLASPQGLFAGTRQAHLLHLAGDTLAPVPAFEATPGRDAWYTPWGGPPDVRSMDCSADGTLYVNVHVGGIVASRDRGETWAPTLDIDLDVHEVLAGEGGLVLAATGAAGLALSRDGGRSWHQHAEGLHGGYCRAVAVTGDLVLISASTGPGSRRGAVYRRPLASEGPFERLRGGLPEWFGGNVDSGWIDAAEGMVAIGTPEGEIHVSDDDGERWSVVATGLPRLRQVLIVAT